MHISIVVVHYNNDKDTLSCLKSLLELETKIDHQIVIVDNGSSEKLKIPIRFAKNHVRLIRSEANLGFTGGNNMGTFHAIEAYNSDYILYLNNDTLIKRDLLDQLLEVMKKDPSIDVLSPHIYFAPGSEFHKKSYSRQQKGSVFWFAGGFIDWRQLTAGHIGVDEYDYGQFAHLSETEFNTGCCMLIKREVLEKISLFDKRFFLYYEDTDLSLRAQKAGFKTCVTANTQIWHKNAGSSQGSGSDLHVYYQTRNRLLFFFIHGSLKTKLLVLRLAVRLLFSANPVEKKASWHFLSMQYGKQPLI